MSGMEGLNELKAKAEVGNDVAQYDLGQKYRNGDGVPVNLEKAFELFSLSAEHGNISAQLCVAKMYEKGEGVKKDLPKAVAMHTVARNLLNAYRKLFVEQGHTEGIDLHGKYMIDVRSQIPVLTSRDWQSGGGVDAVWEAYDELWDVVILTLPSRIAQACQPVEFYKDKPDGVIADFRSDLPTRHRLEGVERFHMK